MRSARRTSTAARNQKRSHRVPPPLTRGNEPFEGAEILEEMPSALGGLLWNSLRNVSSWARAGGNARGAVFVEGAGRGRENQLEQIDVPPPLAEPLRVLARLLDGPSTADTPELSSACESIADWAVEQDHLGTAVAFLQAVVLVQPQNAAVAYRVGRLTRRRCEGPRAETWFRHALAIARGSGDWESYAQAHLGLGNLYSQRGNLPTARRLLTRALRAARRHGLRRVEAMALHDLFVVAALAQKIPAAERFAAAAAEAYGRGAPQLDRLAFDLAFLWTNHGRFALALSVFEHLEPRFPDPPARLQLVSAYARAAAAEGEMHLYERYSAEALTLVGDSASREVESSALLNLAHAAASAGEWERAIRAAERAATTAAETGEGKVRLTAEAVADEARRQRSGDRPAERVASRAPVSDDAAEVADTFRHLLSAAAT